MRRRLVAFFVASAVLIVPALSLGLPRPTDNYTAQESRVTQQPIRVFGNDSVGVATPFALVDGRKYRFEVRGTWKPSGSSSNFADAACETTNGSNWSKTGKGFVIHATNYGSFNNNELTCNSQHVYSINWTGRGVSETLRVNDPSGYSDNSGYLEVDIWQQSIVTYEMLITEQTLPGQTVNQPIPGQTITPGSVPPVTVPPVTVPGVGLPQVGSISFSHNGAGQWCITITTPVQTVPVACVFDPGKGAGAPLPDTTINIGGNTITDGTKICDPNCTILPGTPLPPITVPGQTVSAGIPPGSKLKITFSWTSDTTRLWKFYSDRNPNTGEEATALWAPFHTTGVSWYRDQVAQGNVGAKITVSIKDPNGQDVAQIPSLTIPGLGQILEAGFMTRVPGVDE